MLSEVAITLTEYSGSPVPVMRPWWRFWQRQVPVSPYLPAKVRDDLILLRAGLNERRAREENEAVKKAERTRKRGRT